MVPSDDGHPNTVAGPLGGTRVEEVAVDTVSEELPPGTVIGGCRIEALVSRGGFASIYRARDPDGGLVALKLLWRELAESVRLVKRFRHEAEALARLSHPNIVSVRGVGTLDDGRPWFVMEWLDGGNLRERIRALGPLSPTQALAAAEEIGAALAAAHAVGIVHRDLKAANVMVGPGLSMKVVDFGIAKVLEPERVGLEAFHTTSTILGTPFYMAPEQILGDPVDPRTDLYALGLLLFEMVTGSVPFRAETRVEVEDLHLHAPPPLASDLAPVSAAFDAVVLRCLEKDAKRRYPTVDALLADLRPAAVAPPAAQLAGAARTGAALYIEARIDSDLARVDDAALGDVEAILETARAALAAAGLTIDLESATSILGVAVLPVDDAESQAARRALALAARDLARALEARPSASPHVRASLMLHAGPVDVRGSELIGRDLLAVGAWAADHPGAGLALSAAAAAGLEEELRLEPRGRAFVPVP